ncbi:hypothetical protein IU514_18670 [Lysobacter niastensis]|uniref:Uncharacterized protein n=2 Tax=Lysobacter niastensis TaxID=380629 RepID=A0ABS0BEF4_9GAMM|nr:hypothetical protein [Lysobacter niastensis]
MSERPEPRQRWQDVAGLAQIDVAEALSRAIGDGRLDGDRYRNWLAMESALCRIGALTMDAAARWHGTQPDLQACALGWSGHLRGQAAAAALDVQAMGDAASVSALPLDQWRAFIESTCGSQRAGEAVGTALLHGHLSEGAMRPLLGAIRSLPFAGPDRSRYLAKRLEPVDEGVREQRKALLNAYSAAALSIGAQRAARWYGEAMSRLLAPATS